jgi:hypothetical protein
VDVTPACRRCDKRSIDWKAAALALVAAFLMLRLQRGLVETVAVRAAAGILLRFLS